MKQTSLAPLLLICFFRWVAGGEVQGVPAPFLTSKSKYCCLESSIPADQRTFGVADLKQELLDPGRYTKTLPPAQANKSRTDPDQVQVQLYVTDLVKLDVQSLQFHLRGYLRTWWYDERLQYSQYSDMDGVASVNMLDVKDKLWVPDLYVDNSISVDFDGAELLKLYPDGKLWSSRAVYMVTACPMDLSNMPFDVQTCKVKLGSYSSDSSLVSLAFKQLPDGAVAEPLISEESTITQFAMIETRGEIIRQWYNDSSSDTDTDEGDNMAWDWITFYFTFERSAEYYLSTVMVPGFFFCLMAYVNFWIDRKMPGPRVSLAAITTLIVYSQVGAVYSRLPQITYPTWFTSYLHGLLMLNTFCLVEYGVVNVLHRYEVRRMQLALDVQRWDKIFGKQAVVNKNALAKKALASSLKRRHTAASPSAESAVTVKEESEVLGLHSVDLHSDDRKEEKTGDGEEKPVDSSVENPVTSGVSRKSWDKNPLSFHPMQAKPEKLAQQSEDEKKQKQRTYQALAEAFQDDGETDAAVLGSHHDLPVGPSKVSIPLSDYPEAKVSVAAGDMGARADAPPSSAGMGASAALPTTTQSSTFSLNPFPSWALGNYDPGELEQLRGQFEDLDTQLQGSLPLSSIMHRVIDKHPELKDLDRSLGSDLIARYLRSIDYNGDGELSFTEYLWCMLDDVPSLPNASRIAKARLRAHKAKMWFRTKVLLKFMRSKNSKRIDLAMRVIYPLAVIIFNAYFFSIRHNFSANNTLVFKNLS